MSEQKIENLSLLKDSSPKTFKHGSKELNLEGLINSRKITDQDFVRCEKTKKELYFIREDGTKVNLRSYGQCEGCKKVVVESQLQMNAAEKSRWPIVWVGAYCLACWPNGREED